MDILNCFTCVKQPNNFIQPLVRLRTSCPWRSLLGADQKEVLGWHLLGGAALEQCPWHCQHWHRLGAAPESQNGAGVMPLLPSVSPALLPQEPLPRGGKLWEMQHSLWVVIPGLHCFLVHGPARTLLLCLLNAFLNDLQSFQRLLPYMIRAGVGN